MPGRTNAAQAARQPASNRALESNTHRDLKLQRSVTLILGTATPGGEMASRAIRSRITVNYRGGELFLHVTLDGSQDLDEHGFADKSKIEEALDVVLKSNNLGCHFGGGTGLRYSYIDLAFLDVDAGIQAVRQRLQAGRTPKRSWIQFLTTTWRQNGSEFTTTVRRHP